MKLFATSLFANFSASTYNYVPAQMKINRGLFQELGLTAAAVCPADWQLWVFGDYALEASGAGPVTWFDFPAQDRLDRAGFVPLMADNWAAAVDELYARGSARPCVFLLTSEYLAALVDPRPVLLALKKLAWHNRSSAVVVYTPEQQGIRCWTEKEFKDFLLAGGFELTETSRRPSGIVFNCRLSPLAYRHYLQQQGLQDTAWQSDFLLVTTEDASLKKTGGIGTYVANVKALNDRCITLFCDLDPSVEARDGRTVLISSVIEHLSWEMLFDGNGLIEAVKVVLFLLPNLRVCEFQDYHSLGFRLVQAKRTGLLPQSLWLRVFLHGPVDHIKFGEQNEDSANYSISELKLTIKDNYTFKYADECWAPSKYLTRLLQREFGHQLHNLTLHRLPFNLGLMPDLAPVNFSQIKKIIFIGKYMHLKGWPDFIQAMELLGQGSALADIREIISVAPDCPGDEHIQQLGRLREYKWLSFNHRDLIEFVLNNRQDSLFVLPSRGENYPNVVLEQLLLSTRFIAYNTGGAVEVVDDEQYVRRFFSDPSPAALAAKIEEILALPVSGCQEVIGRKSSQIFRRQQAVNHAYERTAPAGNNLSLPAWDWAAAVDITVLTPVYNTPIHYLQDLFNSILGSLLRPKEWVIIDDGSQAAYHEELVSFIEDCSRSFPARVVRQENKGLAGARNCGLGVSQSKYSFLIDSDDVLLPETLSECFIAMQIDETMIAASGFPVCFSELAGLSGDLSEIRRGEYWKPIGVPEARALALYENQFISASVLVNTEKVRGLGGWDETDRSTWEDWAFYTRMAWAGERFSLVPAPGYLYRNTPGSMSKTYNRYFGRRRLIRNMPVLSRLDANVIFSLIHAAPAQASRDNLAQLDNRPYLFPKEMELISLVRRIRNNVLWRMLIKLSYWTYSGLLKLTGKKRS